MNKDIQWRKWEAKGCPAPPPDSYKQWAVKEAGKGFDVFVETGTYLGDMVWAQRHNFYTIYSIELGRDLHDKAVDRFRECQNVFLLIGDSADILKWIIKMIHEPALFWLDAHFSGGITVKGDRVTPILAEIDIIKGSSLNHKILIDDARCFGKMGFPSLKMIRKRLNITIKNDIIYG